MRDDPERPTSRGDRDVPFVLLEGDETDLLFDDDTSNGALVELRRFITRFVERVDPDAPQVWQWERHIEL